jgi:hypothetical protein
MSRNSTTDPVLDEIYRTRREMSARFDGDFTAMLDDARRRQAAAGRPMWTPPTGDSKRIRADELPAVTNG